MPKRIPFPFLLSGLLATLLIFACDSNSGDGSTDNFDRQAMLHNYADNLIKPAYTDLQSKTDILKTVVSGFNVAPSAGTLTALQDAWTNAYTSWQYANAYNFGPAGEEGLRKGLIEEIGTFPASETKIEDAIAAGQWDMEDFNRDARGFLSIEYLIFGKNQSADEVLAAFAGNADRGNYLAALAENLHDRVGEVVTAWNGTYRDAFVQNDGTDVGSSTSQLYNEFVRSYESIKNFKLGLPLGKRAGQVQVEPQLVEAFYSGQSLAMLKAHLAAIEAIWYGRAKNGQDGIGFREYLEKVEGGPALIADTETQLANVKAALAAVPETPDLSDQISGDKAKLETLYTELQKMTRFFKSDMSSLLGIAITFSSSDGD
ncbi:MAG TPA: imelysin family protein [Saprospiraceae bacterium]|nr:imelysin family protein [Saprospiraceae bacterium]